MWNLTLDMNLKYSVTLKSVGLSLHFEWFIYSWMILYYHALNIWKLRLTELYSSSKYWHISLCNIFKFVNITTNLFRKGCKYWETISKYRFSKILIFCLKAQISSFWLATNTVSCFSWTDRFTLFIFCENVCQITNYE